MSKQVVILLHGVGSNGKDLSALGDFWKPALPDTVFLSPNAPFHFDQGGGGFQWFSLTGVTTENRPQRIYEARKRFDETISRVCVEQDINPDRDKIVFVGFSQGSIMSLDALVSGRYPLAGIVAFSGRLSSPLPYENRYDTPVLLIHGKSDPVIPWSESEKAKEQLTDLGFTVEARYEDHTQHTISPEGAMAASEFIQQCFSE
ncbi:alpha/beta hydrolase [Vibrio sp. FJH11]